MRILFAILSLLFCFSAEAQTTRRIQSSDITGALGYTPIQSIQGMTGVITCGTGLLCNAQSLSLSTFPVTSLSGLGTGVATSLQLNIGSAGAPVVNGGALGTPSSGVATNLTGTATALNIGGNAATATNAASVALGGITGLGTGVATSLGISVGVAGAPVVFNGALGTPASGVGTNLTALNASNITSGTLPVARLSLSQITNSLGADVNLNNIANYFDGPSIAQGTSGTWFASGTVTLFDSVTALMNCKLWDGTTIISSSAVVVLNTTTAMPLSLSGIITNPAANIRISCRDTTNTTGKILFNQSGNSKDGTISAFRLN